MIHILPEEVANKIAAGEVVERPASVVKELVENSLDAGATEIEVHVKHGGFSLIRVSDNGSGMSNEDARLSLVRYATSKIKSAEDIFHIQTFGFRGEAIPSIAAVSRFRLATRLRGQLVGMEIQVEGGKILGEKQAAGREGTVIEVRDLFFNTPARRKFLKSERTEMTQLTETLSLISLSNPGARFLLAEDGKNILDLPKTLNIRTRIRDLYDGEFESRLVPVSGGVSGVQISGFVGKPELAQAHRRNQIFFVNGRPVKSTTLGFALNQAFHGLVMDERFPVGILFLEVNPELVDVNVHPTKREVRISSERAVQNLMVEIIRDQILSKDLFPAVVVTEERCSEEAVLPRSVREHSSLTTTADRVAEAPPNDYETFAFQENLESVRILGQVHASFLAGEYEGGLIIIDQHAAHERVQFEAVLAALESGKVESQGLLVPETFTLTAREELILKDALPFLKEVGFVIEPFGPRTYAVQAHPVFAGGDTASFIKNYLNRLEDEPMRSVMKDRHEELAALMACKSRSVKARDRMTQEEMEALIHSLRKTKSPFTCPHGRPTVLKITLAEFEKHFKRI